jgi:hypothetical protein
MSLATYQREQREHFLPSTLGRHPVSSGVSLAVLFLVLAAGIMVLPDLIRYIRIRNM